jgi:anti-anti-sigma factor
MQEGPGLRNDLVKLPWPRCIASEAGVRAVMQASPATPQGDLASIEIRAIPGGVVISLSGDHDLSTKRQLVESLARVRRERRVLIDLQQCTFVDSTIIGAILAACRAGSSREPHVSVVLPHDTSYVYRALSVIGLRDLVPAHLSIEAALEASPVAEQR